MRPDPHDEARRWLRQAQNDLAAGEALSEKGFYAQACFQAQQAAEKALKALNYLRAGRTERAHYASGTSGLLEAIIHYEPSFRRHEEDAGLLDQYYVPTRYPDAIPDRAPYEVYFQSQAMEALEKARQIVGHVEEIVTQGT